jgi:hypothetical protein
MASLSIQQPQKDRLSIGRCPVCRSTIYADVVFTVRVYLSPDSGAEKIGATAQTEWVSSSIEHTCSRDDDD